jgi:hypothetical protein
MIWGCDAGEVLVKLSPLPQVEGRRSWEETA